MKQVYNATLYGYWLDQSKGIWKTRDHNKYKIDENGKATLIDGSHIPTDVCQPPSFSILDVSGSKHKDKKKKEKKRDKKERKEKKKDKKERENKRQKKD